MPKWWNWQTRYVQGVVSLSSCGFKSRFRHQSLKVWTVVLTITCRAGGIGRRVRLRGVWATVRVQVPRPTPNAKKTPKFGVFFAFGRTVT